MSSESKSRICPICHKEFTEEPAISRRDKNLSICSACATKEALEDVPNSCISQQRKQEIYNLIYGREHMNFEQFTKYIRKQLKKQLNMPIKVIYNNDRKMIGLGVINDKLESIQVIELESFYEIYNSTGKIEDILIDIRKTYDKNRKDIEWYRDFNKVQGNIYYMLLNENVKGMLKDAIYDEYLDLVRVYYVYDNNKEMFSNGHILIHKHHLRMWNITEQELIDTAEKNMQSQPINIENTINVISEAYREKKIDLSEEMYNKIVNNVCMYYIRYENLRFGAAILCNKEALRKFSEKHDCKDIYLLPSSIYEILLMPSNDKDEFDMMMNLEDTVYFVNKNEAAKEDILSYSVYVYRYKTDTVEIL